MSTQQLSHRKLQVVRLLAILLCLGLAGGCQESGPESAAGRDLADGATQSPGASKADGKGGTATDSVALQFVSLQEYEAELAKLHGKVVLVDYWATWCGPCRKQFPHSVKLAQQYRDRGLVVVSVSIDQLDVGESLKDLETRVLGFLKEQHADFQNLVIPLIDMAAGDPAATDIVTERLDLPGGSIPHYKLFDRQGKLHRKFYVDPETGAGYVLQEIDTEIEKLLKK